MRIPPDGQRARHRSANQTPGIIARAKGRDQIGVGFPGLPVSCSHRATNSALDPADAASGIIAAMGGEGEM